MTYEFIDISGEQVSNIRAILKDEVATFDPNMRSETVQEIKRALTLLISYNGQDAIRKEVDGALRDEGLLPSARKAWEQCAQGIANREFAMEHA